MKSIKAGYYGKGQLSLFTVVVYIKEGDNVGCKNYVLETPENDHSCNISFGLNKLMVSQICSNNNIHTVKFWSDDCALQFCSQYAFYIVKWIFEGPVCHLLRQMSSQCRSQKLLQGLASHKLTA